MAKVTQPTLSGGELAPGLRGRTDIVRYQTSLALCHNVITKPTGGAVKRSGTRFRGRAKYPDRYTRLLPFVYSTQVKYLIEAGDAYFRFWVGGALLTLTPVPVVIIGNSVSPVVGTGVPHGMATGDHVLLEGIRGMTRLNGHTYQITVTGASTFTLNGVDTTGDPAYVPALGSITTAAKVVEVATPYTAAELPRVKFTQSADVLFLAHPTIATRELRRLTATSFELRNFAFRRGPFRPFNVNEAAVMAVSGTQGVIQVTTNVDTFTAAMVGAVVYIEEKELRSIKPWSSGEKNIAVGALRRSDQKVYRVSAVASGGTAGSPYRITGATRPTHNSGRAWDGPGDIKSDGVNDYAVGAEWEFVHNTFGIFQITGYTNARQVTATVVERIPDSLVGTAPSPAAGPFAFVGDGTTRTFSTPGITSENPTDFVVTLNGGPVQSNPSYPGGGGVSGGGGGNPRPGNDNNDLARTQLV